MSSATLPRLPLDLVCHILQRALFHLDHTERPLLALSVSLVCRDLRAVGQGALYAVVRIGNDRPSPPAMLDRLTDSKSGLSSFVRRVEWVHNGSFDDYELGEAFRSTYNSDRDTWERILRCSKRASAVLLDGFPPTETAAAMEDLTFTGRLHRFEAVIIRATPPTRKAASSLPPYTDRAELGVAYAVSALPSLSHLDSNLFVDEGPSPYILSSRPLLRLQHFHARAAGPPFPSLSSKLLPPVLDRIDTSTLLEVSIGVTPTRTAFLAWLASGSFPSVCTLSFFTSSDPLSDLLPLLSPLLPTFPSLDSLELALLPNTAPPACTAEADLSALRSFLVSLPRTLRRASLPFLLDGFKINVETLLGEASGSALVSVRFELGGEVERWMRERPNAPWVRERQERMGK
ncbi:hypothetical protein JCM8097_006223 [Rhodosporidiobolus ruineniae]